MESDAVLRRVSRYQATAVAAAVLAAGLVVTWAVAGVLEQRRLHAAEDAMDHQHLYSIFSRQLDGTVAGLPGTDISVAAEPAQAMSDARRTATVIVSTPYHLLRDRGLPAAQQQWSYAMVAPVYRPAAAGPEFRGWVLMGLRGQNFIAATLRQSTEGLLDARLVGVSTAGRPITVAELSPHRHVSLTREVAVPVAQQRWTLQTEADSALLPGGDRQAVHAVMLSGGLISLLLAVIAFMLASARRRWRRRLDTATAQLRATEQQAREQADLLSDVLTSISEGVIVVDAEGRLIHHNPAAAPMVTTDEHGTVRYGTGWLNVFRPDGVTPLPLEELPLYRALREGRPVERVDLTVDCAALAGAPLSVSAYPLGNGRRGAVAVFRDVTARLRNTEELAAAEARARDQADLLEAILDNISDGVGVVDADGRFILHNPAAKDILGIAEDRDGPEHWQSHYGLYTPGGAAPFPTDQLPLVRALAGEATDHVEMLLRNAAHPGGITITVSGRPLRTHAGLTGAVAVFHDITVAREREADLTAFAAVAAHDLQTPLTAIAGFAELLDDDIGDHADHVVQRQHLDRIRQGVLRMRGLITALLAYATARDAPLHQQPVDLQTLVADIVVERTDHLRTGTSFPDIYTGPLPVVYADPTMTRQLLDNLIGNALKYTVPGQPARVDIAAYHRSGDDQVHIQIADRGIGIPPADQPHVFTTFHRVAGHRGTYGGTGLGLAICHRVVARHQGTIAVTDNPGGGTRITFTLPTPHADFDDPGARLAERATADR